jgi:hypothetical protein
MKKDIIKADGKKEPYDEEKINSSFRKAGASSEIASEATKTISRKIKHNMSTDEIHQKALDQLKVMEPKVALKYTLKRAIMNMGPEGYVFEKYIAKILGEHGFTTEVGQMLKGYCVEHEIDVVAGRNNKTYLIECKYHNSPGTKSDIKTSLYVYSRFLDIKKASGINDSDDSKLEAWLVTNTKCTSDAVKYSNCVGLKILAWHYPKTENLQYYIETKNLYPISILSTITEKQKDILFDYDIILVKELIDFNINKLTHLIGADHSTVSKILDEVSIIS